MGYFNMFFKHVIYFQIQGLYDVIMGNMTGFAIFQDKKYKFGELGYFDANFQKLYNSKFKASMTSV